MLKDPPIGSAIVLAAGLSTRLGRQKLVEELAPGVPVLAELLGRLRTANLTRRTLVVTRPHATELQALAAAHGAETVLLASSAQSASLKAGLKAAQGAGPWLILLGDQPLIEPALLWKLSAALKGQARAAAFCVPGHGVRPPALFAEAALPELVALEGDKGAKAVLKALSPSVAWVRTQPGDWLLDADTEEAIARLREAYARANGV